MREKRVQILKSISAVLMKHKRFLLTLLVTFPDELHSETEERYISIGIATRERVLLVVHTEQEEIGERIVIHIISCRKATLSERIIYEKGEQYPQKKR